MLACLVLILWNINQHMLGLSCDGRLKEFAYLVLLLVMVSVIVYSQTEYRYYQWNMECQLEQRRVLESLDQTFNSGQDSGRVVQ